MSTFVWRKAPGGRWLVWGPHSELVKAMEEGTEVDVRTTEGRSTMMAIEHVTFPTPWGQAYGWPVGTRASAQSLRNLGPAPYKSDQASRPAVRTMGQHGQYRGRRSRR